MSTIKRISAILSILMVGTLGLAACADKGAEREDGGVAGQTEEAYQEAEEKGKDVEQEGKVAAQRAQGEVEQFIGGGPIESDTRKIVEKVEREMQPYKQRIEEQGEEIDEKTQIKFDQIEQRISLVKTQYNQLVRDTELGVAQIDVELENLAEDIEDSWEDLEDNLQDDFDVY